MTSLISREQLAHCLQLRKSMEEFKPNGIHFHNFSQIDMQREHNNPMALSNLLNPTESENKRRSRSTNDYLFPTNNNLEVLNYGFSFASDSGPDHEVSKRRYRRHPKPDPCAPKKPQTAYILFSNAIRRGGHYKHMSFTESAQLVAQIWRNLDETNKKVYLDRAEKDRAIYKSAIASYRLTSSYQEYQAYLRRFYNQDGQIVGSNFYIIVRSVGRPRKLPQSPDLAEYHMQ